MRVTVLTGAGISVASGVPPFRGPGGWWTDHPELEAAASHPDLPEDVPRIWELFGPMREICRNARPNAAHLALAEAEARFHHRLTVITQNVDGLHRKAGSKDVIELHGSLLRTRCSQCHAPTEDEPSCPRCGALTRPDIVLFGEPVPLIKKAWYAAEHCDLFLAVGTSHDVSPANQLVRMTTGRRVLVNLEPVGSASLFTEVHLGKAEEVLPELLPRLLV